MLMMLLSTVLAGLLSGIPGVQAQGVMGRRAGIPEKTNYSVLEGLGTGRMVRCRRLPSAAHNRWPAGSMPAGRRHLSAH